MAAVPDLTVLPGDGLVDDVLQQVVLPPVLAVLALVPALPAGQGGGQEEEEENGVVLHRKDVRPGSLSRFD